MNKLIGISKEEAKIFRKLNSPKKIQDFINSIPINFGKEGDTCSSPRTTLQRNRAHCMEGALLAAAILWFQGEKPLLLDLETTLNDTDHVVALFKRHGCWGAISKTNHAVLRYREPIYKNVRELAMSYFHEYFLDSGFKTLRRYSKPFDLSQSADWVTKEKDLWDIVKKLTHSPHYEIMTRPMIASLRLADKVEIQAGEIVEWRKS